MQDHSIIEATFADVEDLAGLHTVSFSSGLERPWRAKDFTASLGSKINTCFILKKNTKSVGYLLYQQVIDEVEIISFGVEPEHQRQGLASSLLSHLLKILLEQDVGRVILEVREDNYGAIYFYKTFGFEEIGRRKNYYTLVNGDRKSAKILSLKLK